MGEAYYEQYSIVRTLVSHLLVGAIVFSLSLVIFTTTLYAWATSVNTCKSRERYSVLTFLEQTIPLVTKPIQQIICP